MKKLLALLDGWKRVIMLAVMLGQVWLLQVNGIDVGDQIGLVWRLFGWKSSDTGVSLELIGTTIGGVVAIIDGFRKALAERRKRQLFVSVPR